MFSALLIHFILPGAALLLGIALSWNGWRGHRVDNHAICRHCRFDLSGGLPTPTACPECGSNLTRPRAMRYGNRRRTWRVLVPGILIVIATIGWMKVDLWDDVRKLDLATIRPDFVLVNEVLAGSSSTIPVDLLELSNRVARGELSESNARALIERGLAAQADQKAPWIPEWEDLLANAWSAGLMTDGQAQAYITHGFSFSVTARNPLVSAQPCPISLCWTPARIARSHPHVNLRTRLVALEFLDVTAQRADVAPSDFTFICRQAEAMPVIRHTPGRHRVRTTWLMQLSRLRREPDRTSSIHEFTQVIDCALTIAPAETPIVTLSSTGRARQTFLHGPRLSARIDHSGEVSLSFYFEQVPYGQVGGAWDVFVRDGGEEWFIGQFTTSDREHRLQNGPVLPEFDKRTVDLVLRANADLAAHTLDLHQIWDGEVVFERIEIEWPENKGKTNDGR